MMLGWNKINKSTIEEHISMILHAPSVFVSQKYMKFPQLVDIHFVENAYWHFIILMTSKFCVPSVGRGSVSSLSISWVLMKQLFYRIE